MQKRKTQGYVPAGHSVKLGRTTVYRGNLKQIVLFSVFLKSHLEYRKMSETFFLVNLSRVD
jgi:hypothetical protein